MMIISPFMPHSKERGYFRLSLEQCNVTKLAVEWYPWRAVNSFCSAGDLLSYLLHSCLFFHFGKFRTLYRGAGHKPFLAKDKSHNRLLEFQRA